MMMNTVNLLQHLEAMLLFWSYNFWIFCTLLDLFLLFLIYFHILHL